MFSSASIICAFNDFIFIISSSKNTPQIFGHTSVATYKKGPLQEQLRKLLWAGHIHLSSSGTQWVTGRCQWYHAPYTCFSKREESASSSLVYLCYGWLRPLRVIAALDLMPGLSGALQLGKEKGLALSIISTQGFSNVYSLLLICSNRIWRKCKISKGICKYNFFLVGHCHRNYCYRI